MRRAARLLAVLALVAGPVVVSVEASQPAASLATIEVVGVTDNYKARYNQDPSVRERRSWLQLRSFRVGAVSYTPTSLPPPDDRFTPTEAVTGSDGSAGVVTLSAPAGRIDGGSFRTDQTGIWGPIITVTDPATLRGNPIPVTLTLSIDGTPVASLTADYTYDGDLASAPPENIEHNGPGGRFWLGCTPTPTDWESAPPPDTCGSAGVRDLRVALSATTNVAVGDDFTYTATVTSLDARKATGVRLVLTPPSGVRLQSFSPPAGVTCALATATCSAPGLTARSSFTVQVTAAAVAPGAQASTATVSSSRADPNPADNTASRSVSSEGFACTTIGTAGPDRLDARGSAREVLCGLGGDDVLTGRGGSDQLYGGNGDDTLRGGAGNDVLTGGPGDDTIQGGTQATGGADRVSFADARSSVVVNVGQLHSWDDPEVPGDAAIGYDAISGVEGAIGSPFADTMLGGSGAERLEGVGGSDRIWGYGGSDVLDGGVGADEVYAGPGADRVLGNEGDDLLRGEQGADSLDGQAGVDDCDAGTDPLDTESNCET